MEYVPLSEQFHVELGARRTSLSRITPAMAGAGTGEPGTGGGLGEAHPCPVAEEAGSVVMREEVLDHTAHGCQATLTEGKGYDRADNKPTEAAKGYAFKEHAIAKKCHH